MLDSLGRTAAFGDVKGLEEMKFAEVSVLGCHSSALFYSPLLLVCFLGQCGDRAQVLTVDMQGYELQADGSRGEPLDIGSVPCQFQLSQLHSQQLHQLVCHFGVKFGIRVVNKTCN